MNILGLQCGYNGGACVVIDGNIAGYAKTGKGFERGVTKRRLKKLLIELNYV